MKDLISLIFRALQSEFEAIQIYKEVANEARQLNKQDVAGIFDEIARDEMAHIGNLEKLLKVFEKEQYDEFLEKLHEGMQETAKDLDKEEQAEDSDFREILKFVKNSSVDYTLDSSNTSSLIKIFKASLSEPSQYFNKLKSLRTNNKVDFVYNKDDILVCFNKK